MITQQYPVVNMHVCPACQRPHHWLQGRCFDENCPWTHHRASYGEMVANLGECNCTLEAVGSHMAAIIPTSAALEEVLVEMPGLSLATIDGTPYVPTADEWLHIMGAIVDDQRSMGQGQVWDNYLADLRDAAIQGASIEAERAWLRDHAA